MAEAVLPNRRVFVGNLSPTVDEYALVKLFGRCGAISDINFLFHKAGPLKGQPRGYAFLEFASADQAQHAIVELDGRTLRGKRLNVTAAREAPASAAPEPSQRRRGSQVQPTALSLIKGGPTRSSTAEKIAALEKRLAQLADDSESVAFTAPPNASLPNKPP